LMGQQSRKLPRIGIIETSNMHLRHLVFVRDIADIDRLG
jgi:hypothetical protein